MVTKDSYLKTAREFGNSDSNSPYKKTMAIKDDYEQDNNFMIEEDLPLLKDQEE